MLVSLSISNVAALTKEVSRIYPNVAPSDMNDALARAFRFENAASMHAVLGNGDLSAFCDRQGLIEPGMRQHGAAVDDSAFLSSLGLPVEPGFPVWDGEASLDPTSHPVTQAILRCAHAMQAQPQSPGERTLLKLSESVDYTVSDIERDRMGCRGQIVIGARGSYGLKASIRVLPPGTKDEDALIRGYLDRDVGALRTLAIRMGYGPNFYPELDGAFQPRWRSYPQRFNWFSKARGISVLLWPDVAVVTKTGEGVPLGHKRETMLLSPEMHAEALPRYTAASTHDKGTSAMAEFLLTAPHLELQTPNCDGPPEMAKRPYKREVEKVGADDAEGLVGKGSFTIGKFGVSVRVYDEGRGSAFQVQWGGGGQVLACGGKPSELGALLRFLDKRCLEARALVLAAAREGEWQRVETIETLALACRGSLAQFTQGDTRVRGGMEVSPVGLARIIEHNLDPWLRCGGIPRPGKWVTDGEGKDVLEPSYSNVVEDIQEALNASELCKQMSKNSSVWEDCLGMKFKNGKAYLKLRTYARDDKRFLDILIPTERANAICDEMLEEAALGRYGLCRYYHVPGPHGVGDIGKMVVEDHRENGFMLLRPLYGAW